jgi:hypothetical protein
VRQQRPPLEKGRAAAVSTGLHAGLVALVLLGGGLGHAPRPAQGPIIEAELVAVAPARPAAEVPTQTGVDETPPPSPAEAPPLPTETVTEAPPEPDAAEREPPAAPREPPAPPLEAARVEIPPPGQPDNPEPAPAPSDEAPLVPAPTAAQRVATGGRAPAADDVPPAAVAAEDAPAETAAPMPPAGQPLDAEAERLLGRQLSSWTGRFTPGDPDPTMKWRKDGQQFTAVLHQLPTSDVMGMERIAVEVTTEREGQRLTTELRMTRLAFSNFAQFVDRWDPEVQIHDDEIDGRFHSNTEIKVSRGGGVQPVFRGKVTLAARDIETDGVGWLNRRTLFPAGIETSVRRIALAPRASVLESLSTDAEVQRFDRDTLVTFYADGSYGWRDVDAGTPEARRPLGNSPHYLIAEEGVALLVKGTVNGTVLVYSPDRIVIADDLRYAADPRAPDADDYLGLVAERNVEIGDPELTGSGDLDVQASIYARRRFAVRSFRSRPSGTLNIFGSVTAGSVTATEPRFATKIEFDERLTTMRAPGFPLSDRYELESWSGEWRAVSAPPPLPIDGSARASSP